MLQRAPKRGLMNILSPSILVAAPAAAVPAQAHPLHVGNDADPCEGALAL